MKAGRLFGVVIVLLAAAGFSAAAGQGSRHASKSRKPMSPSALVVDLYRQHKQRSPFFQTRSRTLLDKYFQKELADLLWQDAHTSGDEVGALDGDPLFNAQDMEIKNFSIRDGFVTADLASVPVSFENFGAKHQIVFRLVKQRSGWKIADIKYDDGVTLKEILKRDRNPEQSRVTIKVYLVAVGDDGKTGKKFGCGDSLVPVTSFIEPTAAPLQAALERLLEIPQHADSRPDLENFWKGRSLKVQSVSIRSNTATIHISGAVFVAGACDIPRIESQIEETAQQFPSVKRVKVFIGKRTLAEALR